MKKHPTCCSDSPVKGQKALLCTRVKTLSELRFLSVTAALEAVCPLLPGGRWVRVPCPPRRSGRAVRSSRVSSSQPQLLTISSTVYLASSCSFALISFHGETGFRKERKRGGGGRERRRKYVEALLKNFSQF